MESGSMFCSSCGSSAGSGTQSSNYTYTNNNNNSSYGNTANSYPTPLKSNGIGIVLAFILPGLGHMYAGKITDGLLLFFVAIVLLVLTVFLLFPIIIYLVVWIWNIYAANKLVNEYNNEVRRTGNPPW